MDMVFLVPKTGLALVMPDGSVFPAEGNFVLRDQFIERRIADGDLIQAPTPAATPQKKGA